MIFLQQKTGGIGISEAQAKFTQASSLKAYEIKPETQDDILANKEYAEYHDHMVEIQRGTKPHLFFGHGATQDAFEKRDFATTGDLFYGDKQKTHTIIDPHVYASDVVKTRSKLQINGKDEDLPKLFGKTGTAAGETIPKHYNQFTAKFDNNCLKTGLRK